VTRASMLTPAMAHQHQISDLGGLGKLTLPSTKEKMPVDFLVGKISIALYGKVNVGLQLCFYTLHYFDQLHYQ